MPPALMDPPLPQSSSVPSSTSAPENPRFRDLRGLHWRINLGVLPSSSTSIDDLRRATADSRRRYASLRRCLLVDPHTPKDGSNSPDLALDNPLSQNPESTWSRFFRNAELERMVDQDLSRLYPEHDTYFQTPGCQGILRRILLLWCLRHPESGYRQGMHELLAPLLYVLQIDVERLLEVRKLYEDHFTDTFDGLLCQENDLSYSFDFRKSPDLMKDEVDSYGNATKAKNLNELDPEIQTIVLLSDAYGAEGELGIVLSEKFMEHDAYCMFDALMNGANGSVAMAEFFSSSPATGSHTGLPPVIEASTALYHLLFLVDSSLHSHLVELGVEPQYFALRWLRVLFGREFSLYSLLIIWDEIFASDNRKVEKGADNDVDSGFRILNSPRGAFISAMAVAMLLHLRSSLLATENPTICLQRLLNFPEDTNIKILLDKAKSLQEFALSADISSSSPSFVPNYNQGKSMVLRCQTLPSESVSPKTPLSLVPDSYWEEKWRVAQEAEEAKQDSVEKQVPIRKKGWKEKVKFSLKRTESGSSSSRVQSGKRESEASARHRLIEDLSKELGFEEDTEKIQDHENLRQQENHSVAIEAERQDGGHNGNNYTAEDRCLLGNTGSEENLSMFSDTTSPPNEAKDRVNDSDSSLTTQSLLDERNENSVDSPLPVSDPPENLYQTSGCDNYTAGNSATSSRERKAYRFQWLWKLGRNTGEVTHENGGASEDAKLANSLSKQSNTTGSSTNVMGTLRNIGQSMIDHIQVIESVFQQDRVQGASSENSKNVLVGKGQVTAMTALKELRKISNLLSEM
ncbi:Ypt/Rab-GAP domain of gyp1p superfamily protein [Senna tora]|uniref:Ypt/Rab-GAP domain of gyp1p superfamily protein n=1 Tax=Senna tora TaxID=362788 RepID=A0A834W7B0_9FABA|nr:Ypt/Rab-GAP domain of gyp1p superfamily protein [Senna tora]